MRRTTAIGSLDHHGRTKLLEEAGNPANSPSFRSKCANNGALTRAHCMAIPETHSSLPDLPTYSPSQELDNFLPWQLEEVWIDLSIHSLSRTMRTTVSASRSTSTRPDCQVLRMACRPQDSPACRAVLLPKGYHSLEVLLSSDSLFVTLASMPEIRKAEPRFFWGPRRHGVRCSSSATLAWTGHSNEQFCYAPRGLKRATSRHLLLTHVQLHQARIQPPVTPKTSTRDRNEDRHVSSSV